MIKPVPCIKCGKTLEDIGSGSPNHASGANSFRSGGQYGSTVFDPMNETYLEINVCDVCIIDATKAGLVLLGVKSTHVQTNLEPWDGK